MVKIGQRWLCYNPNVLVEIISDPKAQSNGNLNAECLIVQRMKDKSYTIGDKVYFYEFPADLIKNQYWQYLEGQDRSL